MQQSKHHQRRMLFYFHSYTARANRIWYAHIYVSRQECVSVCFCSHRMGHRIQSDRVYTADSLMDPVPSDPAILLLFVCVLHEIAGYCFFFFPFSYFNFSLQWPLGNTLVHIIHARTYTQSTRDEISPKSLPARRVSIFNSCFCWFSVARNLTTHNARTPTKAAITTITTTTTTAEPAASGFFCFLVLSI